jgi:RNA polymerase sigma-70 factor, ECF subfamily
MTERTNAEWVAALTAGEAAAVADLREYLVRGLMKVLSGRADASAAEDFAQEAVLKVLGGLPGFRGDSRFLTWALTVGTRVAFSELRKARYRDVPLDGAAEPAAPPPPAVGDRETLLGVLRRSIDTVLTDRQRALIQGELAGVPQAVLAERMSTNRNALYKLGHDARMKLKRELEAAGFTADDVRAALTTASE